MEYSEIMDIVNRRYRNDNQPDDDKLSCIEEVEQAIKNYCQIEEVPVALKFIWSNMAIDLLRYYYEKNIEPEFLEESTIDESAISTIKIGDTSIAFGDKANGSQRSKALSSHRADIDGIVLNYKAQLNRFRRIW